MLIKKQDKSLPFILAKLPSFILSDCSNHTKTSPIIHIKFKVFPITLFLVKSNFSPSKNQVTFTQ